MLDRLKQLIDSIKNGVRPPQKLVVDVSKLSPEQLAELAKGGVVTVPRSIVGDGKAEFLGEGSSEEFEEQERKDKGQHGIFGIGQ